MHPAVAVHNLGKKFSVPQQDGPRSRYGYRTLRDDVMRLLKAPLRLVGLGGPKQVHHDFWALRNLNFQIGRGEVVGVIGRNGAGKSTLLKVLSRITKPTQGEVHLRGRVGSLLEVGTGFHPELTGRENIFLNGAILGMRRTEIQRKFDQIVEFAEISQFLDMPVKRYSSGMYVRLAFAVAAHLEPEILIVDEVLAVGDMAFQIKCLGRMREVGRSGATILFVSHNMPAVESLCSRAILLDQGQAVKDGPVRELVQDYHRRLLEGHGTQGVNLAELAGPKRTYKIFRSANLLDEQNQPTNFVPLGGRFHLRLGLDSPVAVDMPTITIGIDDHLGQRVLSLRSPLTPQPLPRLEGTMTVDCVAEHLPLAPGDYWVKLGLYAVPEDIDDVERVLRFTVTDGEMFGEGRGFHRGTCVTASSWTVNP